MASLVVIVVGFTAVALLAWREHRAEKKESLTVARMMASIAGLPLDMKIAVLRHHFSGRGR